MRIIWSAAIVLGLVMTGSISPATAQQAVKIGVVNQDKVLNDSQEGQRLKAELEKLRDSKAAAIEAKESEIKGLQDQLLNAQLSLSQDKREEIARQLKRKRVEYERLNDDATAEFQDAANAAQAQLQRLFRDVITKYGRDNGYTIIFESNTVYFSSSAIDISDPLLAIFNQTTQSAVRGPSQPAGE